MLLADGATVLEVGVGSGRDIGRVHPANVRVVGLEPDPDLAAAARRHTQEEVHCGTLEALPEAIAEARFQAIALFDVLEHVEDDGYALRLLAERLAPNGRLVLTVAAYSWMWCQHDEVNHHFRRYSRESLTSTLRQAGFRPVTSTYFNFFLFVAIAAFRIASRLFRNQGLLPRIKRAGRSDFDVFLGPLDVLFFRVLSLEARFLGRVRFPFGVSLFMVAERAG